MPVCLATSSVQGDLEASNVDYYVKEILQEIIKTPNR